MATITQIARADLDSLVALEPAITLMPFKWCEFKIARNGFPLTHAMVKTSTACQGPFDLHLLSFLLFLKGGGGLSSVCRLLAAMIIGLSIGPLAQMDGN